LSVSASLSFSQTVCGGTVSSYSPLMVIAIAVLLARARSHYPLTASRGD
jgi:hypothetical protein